MTKGACEFVAPLTFQTMSQNYVVSDMFQDPKTWDVEHISLAKELIYFSCSSNCKCNWENSMWNL